MASPSSPSSEVAIAAACPGRSAPFEHFLAGIAKAKGRFLPREEPALAERDLVPLDQLTANPIAFRFDGLSIAPGDSLELTFSFGTCSNCQGSWQISQQAFETPEPATLALVGVALLLTGIYRRRSSH